MILPLYAFYVIFNSFAIGNSIISKKQIGQEELSSIFWFKIFVSIALMVSAFLVADALAAFYGEKDIHNILISYSGTLLISGISFIYHGLLLKRKNFAALAKVGIASSLTANLVAIVLAYKGYGVYALIIREYINLIMSLVLSILYSKWLPTLHFQSKLLRYHLKFGTNISINGILNYFSRNLDDILIGRNFGSSSLGLYTKSFSLLLLPTQLISKVVLTILLPRFSQIQEKKLEIRRLYLKAARLVLFSSTIICLIVYFTIEDLLYLFDLASWFEIIPMIKVFVILAIFQSIGPLQDLIYQATNRTREYLKFGIFVKLYQIFVIIIAVYYFSSLFEFVLFFSILNSFSLFLNLYFLGITMGEKLGKLLKNITPIIVTALLSFFIIYYLQNFLYSIPLVLRIVLNIVSILFTYLFLSATIMRSYFLELSKYVKLVVYSV
jgi:PST family polysaccharide transporter